MGTRVKEILGWYARDNPGSRANLARMLNHGRLAGTGRMVILPVDQGFEHGPARSFAVEPAGYDPRYHFQLAIEAGCNAYAAPLGFIEAGAADFAGEIPLILKINNPDVLHDEKDPLSGRHGIGRATRSGSAARRSDSRSTPARPQAPDMYEQMPRDRARRRRRTGSRPWSGRIRAARALARRARRRIDVIAYAAQIAGSARRPRHQGQAADGAHRAGRGEEGLREGAGAGQRPWPSGYATSSRVRSTAAAS